MNQDARQGSGPGREWRNRVTAPWMLISGGLCAVTFLVLTALSSDRWLVFLAALAGSVALLGVGAVEVTVNSRQVMVRSIAIPPLRRRIPLTRITGASSKRARPMQLGGWGYRWLPRRTAVSLRAGDAVWLQLENGREFVITVDDAARAAQTVNDNLARGRP